MNLISKKFSLILLCLCLINLLKAQDKPIYKDATQPLDTRVKDLASRLTLEEKVSLLGYNSRAIPRLGIPAYNWWNEGLHGVARAGEATIFPQAIGMAATFDNALLEQAAGALP